VTAVVHVGDVFDVLPTLDAGSVNCCVTSPPYWGLRDYGTATWEGGDAECDHRQDAGGTRNKGRDRAASGGTFHDSPTVEPALGVPYRDVCGKCGARRIDSQLGLEPTPEEYVAKIVAVFREVRRVLRDDGTLWLNLGDSYAAQRSGSVMPAETLAGGQNGWMPDGTRTNRDRHDGYSPSRNAAAIGLKHKDLVGIPWRVAFAIQADGWYLRSEIIWAKRNCMPESVTDRPTKSHETLFLLAKSPTYFYDADAIREPHAEVSLARVKKPFHTSQDVEGRAVNTTTGDGDMARFCHENGRNKRTVWTIATQPYPEAHFATYPEKLVEPCVLAGCPVGGTVLDPFTGSGTTGAVACRLGRNFVGIELNHEYAAMAERRIAPHRDQLQLAVTP
jgi:DNA modification methylase